jgi:hypothetical protein
MVWIKKIELPSLQKLQLSDSRNSCGFWPLLLHQQPPGLERKLHRDFKRPFSQIHRTLPIDEVRGSQD